MALNNVPLAGQSLNATRNPINQNFLVTNAAFKVDHVEYNLAGQGHHNQVFFVQQAADPVTGANEAALYTKAVGASTSLFYQPPNAATPVDLITAGLSATGWCRLPCGLIMKWGKSAAIYYNGTGTAAIATGAGIPNITSLLWCSISPNVLVDAGVVSFSAFDDVGAHTVTATATKVFNSATGYLTFTYLALGT